MYILPVHATDLPREGRVLRLQDESWWIAERTSFVQTADAIVAIGGGRGSFDCVEKAFLSRKPVFVAKAIPCRATDAWNRRAQGYKYISDGDADPLEDLNITPDEFFSYVFGIVDRLTAFAYSRKIFIVHGHDRYLRDTLADILRKLEFEPIILQDEVNQSLTILEKLERDTRKAGFAMILYTPDDLGRAVGGIERPRTRQNVLFEHGLLIGLLGRDRTCAIVHGDVEIPSDIQGMVYERVSDLRGEALKVAKVLKQAGYTVNATALV
jgi:hypothetical protein